MGNTETMKITRKAGHDDLEGDEMAKLKTEIETERERERCE